jgi:arylsulfatase
MPPNILWICADQQRWDTIRALGNPHIRTPHLDRLCAEGMAFERAYCQSPVCTPSRASFLTGLYPSATHANRNGAVYFPANERVQLITRRLATAGYECGLVGKLHLASPWHGEEARVDDGYTHWRYSHSPYRRQHGRNQYHAWLAAKGLALESVFEPGNSDAFARYRPDLPPELHQSAWCAGMAEEFVRTPRTRPWLLSVNPFDPHPPFDAPDSHARRYDPASLPPPLFRPEDLENQARLAGAFFQHAPAQPGPVEQRDKASYYGMVELLDEQLGRILTAVDESGQGENTLVIFMSDHGEMLGDHGLSHKGCRFYEGLVHVPLILRWPGRVPTGRRCRALVELVDLAPTLAEIAGVTPFRCHGRLLQPLIEGACPDESHRASVRCEYYDALNMHAPASPQEHVAAWGTMHFDGRYKLSVYHGLEWGELYDLAADPDEFRNLWAEPSMQEVRHRAMRAAFDATVRAADPGPELIGYF